MEDVEIATMRCNCSGYSGAEWVVWLKRHFKVLRPGLPLEKVGGVFLLFNGWKPVLIAAWIWGHGFRVACSDARVKWHVRKFTCRGTRTEMHVWRSASTEAHAVKGV